MLTIILTWLILFQQEAHVYPDATWEAPSVVQLTWTAENDGLFCAWRRRSGADVTIGCFRGAKGKNVRTLQGDYQVGDVLWVENEGQALPLQPPRFVFLPGVFR